MACALFICRAVSGGLNTFVLLLTCLPASAGEIEKRELEAYGCTRQKHILNIIDCHGIMSMYTSQWLMDYSKHKADIKKIH